jgi:hypothetical protein
MWEKIEREAPEDTLVTLVGMISEPVPHRTKFLSIIKSCSP